MLLPNLRRSTLSQPHSQHTYNRNVEYFKPLNQSHQQVLVPEAFFEECRTNFFKKSAKPVNGILNTVDFVYPKEVLEDISEDDIGDISLKNEIFCFTRKNKICLWRYASSEFTTPTHIISQVFDHPITAVDWEFVTHPDFHMDNILLLAIAFGPYIKLYSVKNFSAVGEEASEALHNLQIRIKSFHMVNFVQIKYDQSFDGDRKKNSLLILWGDDRGNLNLFDFNKKRKFETESIMNKLLGHLRQRPYAQIKNVVSLKNCFICLMEKHVKRSTKMKKLLSCVRIVKESEQVVVEQHIEVFETKVRSFLTSFDKIEGFCHKQILSFQSVRNSAIDKLVERIKMSYHGYFERRKNKDEMKYVDSMARFKNYIQIVFKTGQSITMDENLAFLNHPNPKHACPHYYGLLKVDVKKYAEDQMDQSKLLNSNGRSLMAYSDFLVSSDELMTYFTPYLITQPENKIRKIANYRPKESIFGGKENSAEQFVIFNKISMTYVQKINPKMTLLLLALGGSGEHFPENKFIPQEKFINKQIQNAIELFGPAEIVVWLLELLITDKLRDERYLNIRKDIHHLICEELSTDRVFTFKEAADNYESVINSLIQNKIVPITKDIEDFIWLILSLVENEKVKVPHFYNCNIREIDALCMSLQIVISDIFHPIKNWNSRNFCTKREKTYQILTYSKIMRHILEKYEQKISSKSRKEQNLFIEKNRALIFGSQQNNSQSSNFKKHFCRLCDEALEKINLILEVYDFVSETDLSQNQLPVISELFFNFNISTRMKFSNFILNSIALNNEFLIDKLITLIPEFEIETVRNFKTWSEVNQSNQDINDTSDLSIDDEIQQAFHLMNPEFYDAIEKKILSTSKDKGKEAKVAKVVMMTKLIFRKVKILRQKALTLDNFIGRYQKTAQNYFGVLELPNAEAKRQQIYEQQKFFSEKTKNLISSLFKAENNFSEAEITGFIQSVNHDLTNQMRIQINKELEKNNFNNLMKINKKAVLFAANRPEQKFQAKNSQLMEETFKGYS